MFPPDQDNSLKAAATSAVRPNSSRSEADVSIGSERTVSGDIAVEETLLEGVEIVDLAARYRVEGQLGEGGMGSVFLATDMRLGRKVAIKRILGESSRSNAAMARFLTEARAIAAIGHSNVVQIYELGVAKDGPFLVIEYVDGGSLLDRCKTGAMPVDEAIGVIAQVCDGLARAHDVGIIHRDIKPANILLTKDGVPKLTDFGLAKAEAVDHRMTITGAVIGTPDFMPPEQRLDAALVDQRSDLWSLAATLYQLVTGRSPKVIRLNELPTHLQLVLTKALEDEKDARYQSAREFRDAIKGLGNGGANGAGRPLIRTEELAEGQCKACGQVTSDRTRKFCRNPKCGANLRTACLKCEAQIPVWDGICGECGGNQPALLQARRNVLGTTRTEAESLLGAFRFDDAIARAVELSGESHPDLADFAEWSSSFVTSVKAEKEQQMSLAAERGWAAKAHAAAWDYPAAIQAIESIAEPLRGAEAAGLLAEWNDKKRESDTLIAAITDRVKRKDWEGLVPAVERAVALRGDRKDLARIRDQLAERRDGRLGRARAALATGDARGAAGAVARVALEDCSPQDRESIARIRKAIELEEEIAKLVREAKADSKITPDEAAAIAKAGEQYLELNPNSERIKSLVAQSRQIAEPLPRKGQGTQGMASAAPASGQKHTATEQEMADMLKDNEVSVERIEALAKQAFISTERDKDGDLMLLEGGVRTFVQVDQERKLITFYTLWGMSSRFSLEERLAFVNELNNGKILVRFSIANSDTFWCDYQVLYEGGIIPFNILHSYKRFVNICRAVVADDETGLIGDD